MTKAYSLDLRRRVVRFVDEGHSRHEAAAHFDMLVAFVVKLAAACRTTGSDLPKPEGGWRYFKLDPHRTYLERRGAEKADIARPELVLELAGKGVCVAAATLSCCYLRNDYRYKKTLLASKQERSDVRAARREWIAKRRPRAPEHINVERLGNTVPHLHWGQLRRYKNDRRWGHPIWTTERSEIKHNSCMRRSMQLQRVVNRGTRVL